MCNRFALPSPEEIAAHFGLTDVGDLPPRFNIAPGEEILLVRQAGSSRRLDRCTWGFRPPWLRDPAKPLLNVRAETLRGRPGASDVARRGRCLVPAGGFFEWRRVGRARQPWYFKLADAPLLALAALADVPEAAERRCAIVTTQPNELVAEVHDRMPVVIPPEAYGAWLDADVPLAELQPLLAPFPAERMRAYAVSSVVNRSGVEDPRAVLPAARETLF
jgi:putative SOS response-associated peptidase YedK